VTLDVTRERVREWRVVLEPIACVSTSTGNFPGTKGELGTVREASDMADLE
jgi:hypothetical protein